MKLTYHMDSNGYARVILVG